MRATMRAVQEVHSGRARHAVNLVGGMHHAMAGAAAGFCVYNDAAVAIRWLLDQGVSRVAYVDLDVHHGDGVQAAFYDDPRVLTIWLHESGRTLFPGTGCPPRRWPRGGGLRGERGAACGHRRQPVAAGLQRGGAPGARGVPARSSWSASTGATPTSRT